MNYGFKLKSLRERVGLTQEEMAKVIGIERGTYSLYEMEYTLIPLKHLNTLCNYLNVSLDYIFDFNTEKNYKNYKKSIDKVKVGNRLKEFRKSQKLTQAKLAEKINVARTIISEYEKGNVLISLHALYTICKKYNISADYLLGKID